VGDGDDDDSGGSGGSNILEKNSKKTKKKKKKARCILHRDLKPDNVLITDFLSAKITDFGTSRAMATEPPTRGSVGSGGEEEGRESEAAAAAAMTSVGTPLFAAPEVMRGERYDESADVYSFGVLLLALAVQDDLILFLAERWRQDHGKAKAPKQPMRVIRCMVEDHWRPVRCPPPTPSRLEDSKGDDDDAGKGDAKVDQHHTRQQPQQQPPHPLAYLPGVPPALTRLVVACCDPDPSKRPAFRAVLAELTFGECAAQVTEGFVAPDHQHRRHTPHEGKDHDHRAVLLCPSVNPVRMERLSRQFWPHLFAFAANRTEREEEGEADAALASSLADRPEVKDAQKQKHEEQQRQQSSQQQLDRCVTNFPGAERSANANATAVVSTRSHASSLSSPTSDLSGEGVVGSTLGRIARRRLVSSLRPRAATAANRQQQQESSALAMHTNPMAPLSSPPSSPSPSLCLVSQDSGIALNTFSSNGTDLSDNDELT